MDDDTRRGHRNLKHASDIYAPMFSLTTSYWMTTHPIFTVGVDAEAVRPWLGEAHQLHLYKVTEMILTLNSTNT